MNSEHVDLIKSDYKIKILKVGTLCTGIVALGILTIITSCNLYLVNTLGNGSISVLESGKYKDIMCDYKLIVAISIFILAFVVEKIIRERFKCAISNTKELVKIHKQFVHSTIAIITFSVLSIILAAVVMLNNIII